MTALIQKVTGGREVHFNPRQFVQENITRHWTLTLWLLVLGYLTVMLAIGQLQATAVTTLIVLIIWAITLGLTAFNEITRNHNPLTLWLRGNLYSSLTNAMITLALVLVIIAAVRGFINWAFICASFTTDTALAKATLEQKAQGGSCGHKGANWGAVIANMRNLMVFRWPKDQDWRIWTFLIWNVALFIPSQVIYRREIYRKSRIRKVFTGLWFLTPLLVFFLLRGFGDANSAVAKLNPDVVWGGLLLTLIISVFAIIASFPLGLLLALGRRSTVRGIPAWLTYGALGILTLWLLLTRTQPELEGARSFTAQILAFWPLLFLLFAFLFQRYFKGNVVALFSTVYIETVRGIPFITVLFMSIILFPIFLPPGTEILSTWRVMIAATMFAAAYLAENVRGGLQSLNKGQYEAADAIGLNTFQKYRLIILPQALRAVIPAIVGQFIGLFKDTTLVAIVGLVELLGVANLISAQPDWLGVRREPYVFIAIIYFIGSAIMAGYSRRLEARLGVGER